MILLKIPMNEPDPSPQVIPPKRTLRRRIRRWIALLTLPYLAGAVGLYFAQTWMIFPGAFIHGRAHARITPAPDREIITLHTDAGQRIAAVFGAALTETGDPTPDAASRPTVLFFYGNGDCIATSMGLFDLFRRLGVNVLIPEYIGYPMSSGKPSEQGFYDTASAAYAYLHARPDIDPRQIIVVGRSIGSGPAIDLAARLPVAGLATFSAFTSMDDMAQKVVPVYPTSLVVTTHFDNLRKMASVTCPVFLAHGTNDTFVPFQMMSRLVTQVKGKLTVVPVEGADHNRIFQIQRQATMQKFGAFIDSVRPTATTSR